MRHPIRYHFMLSADSIWSQMHVWHGSVTLEDHRRNAIVRVHVQTCSVKEEVRARARSNFIC